jgi:hypothetical protein
MPTEEQDPLGPLPLSWPDFESVFKRLEKLTEPTPLDRKFPNLELKNRLINIGLREFLEETQHGKERGRALDLFGFPFKFVTQLDEAILATAQFLSRFRDEEGSTLHLYALHRLSKGEEKSLAFWQSPKAKLYIELQNIILLLNEVGGRTSTITRIFSFSKVEDIAFLTQPAISVLSEQLAARINIGFLFLDTFENKGDQDIGQISNAVLIDFDSPSQKGNGIAPELPSTNRVHNFFALRGVLEEKKAHDLPYQDRCAARWYADKATAIRNEQLGNFVNLFDQNKWKGLSLKPRNVCAFPQFGATTSNRAALMMYQAFIRGNTNIKAEEFARRINETVITRDLIRLERAMRTFDDESSNEIRAVDATSIKDSLRIHESNPTYRQWLRRSLSRVLHHGKSLSRIYILEDRKGEDAKAIEFQTFTREVQYYLDYLNYEISEMRPILEAHQEISEMTPILGAHQKGQTSESKKPDCLAPQCNSFKNRIHVYVTTGAILNNFAQQTFQDARHPTMVNEILYSPYSPDPSVDVRSILESLPWLDYLFTEGSQGMIYNFLNRRADPGELRFPASLYRQSFDVDTEINLWFGFLYTDDTFRPKKPTDNDEEFPDRSQDEDFLIKLRDEQLQNRLEALRSSIAEYDQKYDRILRLQLKDEGKFADLKKTIASAKDSSDQKDLLRIRLEIEAVLFQYFQPRFSHLFEMLKYHALEVDLFPHVVDESNKIRAAATSFEDMYPFNQCKGSDPDVPETVRRTPSDELFTLLSDEITERLKDPKSIPEFSEELIRAPNGQGRTTSPTVRLK